MLSYNLDMTFIETHGLVRYGRTRPTKTGICEICQTAPPPATVLDHCHEHGWIRGEVCLSHNALLATRSDRWDETMIACWNHCPDCPKLVALPPAIDVNDPWYRQLVLLSLGLL